MVPAPVSVGPILHFNQNRKKVVPRSEPDQFQPIVGPAQKLLFPLQVAHELARLFSVQSVLRFDQHFDTCFDS